MRVSEGQKFSLTRIFRHFLSFRLILENYLIESKKFDAYRVQRKKYYRVISVLCFFGIFEGESVLRLTHVMRKKSHKGLTLRARSFWAKTYSFELNPNALNRK